MTSAARKRSKPSAKSEPDVLVPLGARFALLLCLCLAYLPGADGPFVFDDLTTLKDNPSIRSLWPLSGPLSPASGGGETFEGRPLANLSFAFNYALGGLNPFGYRLLNLLLHAASAFVLIGLIRRTLSLPGLPKPLARRSLLVALLAAALWALHPLATSAVSYLSRRTDLLVAFFYLAVVYATLRGATDPKRCRAWYGLAVFCAFLGMASKETMVSAPLAALLFDRVFLAGGFRQAWQKRRALYFGLAASWLLLAYLVVTSGNRGGTAGWGTGVSPLDYAFTQGHAIFVYLKLAFWPDPLVFDYGESLAAFNAFHALQGLAVLILFAASVYALWRAPKIGFLGLVFFVLLAPSSSFVPIATQPIAEHRMYLPLACLSVLACVAAVKFLPRWGIPSLLVVTLLFAFASFQRNATYASAERLWFDTLAKRPENARARNSLGAALSYEGRFAEALPHFEEAVRLEPQNASALANLGSCLLELNRPQAALPHLQRAIELSSQPVPQTLFSYAAALTETGNPSQGEAILRQLLQRGPDHFPARMALGNLLIEQRQPAAAAAQFAAAAQLDPNSEAAATHLANAQLLLGDTQAAIATYLESLRIKPDAAATHTNLGIAYRMAGDSQQARRHFEIALNLDPSYQPARRQLEQLP